MDVNADIFKAINNDAGFQADLKSTYAKEVYEALREGSGGNDDPEV